MSVKSTKGAGEGYFLSSLPPRCKPRRLFGTCEIKMATRTGNRSILTMLLKKNRGLWTEIALRAVCWQKEYFERPNFISRPKRKLVGNNDDNHHHPHQRANIVTGSPGLLCANNWSRSLHSCSNWKPIDEGKFVMKSAYTRLKVPTSVLQTVGLGQERLCKRRDGGIHYMQLLDVPPAFVLSFQNWPIWWRTGTPWTHG